MWGAQCLLEVRRRFCNITNNFIGVIWTGWAARDVSDSDLPRIGTVQGPDSGETLHCSKGEEGRIRE